MGSKVACVGLGNAYTRLLGYVVIMMIIMITSVTSTYKKMVQKYSKILTYIQFGNKNQNQSYVE